MLLGLWVSVSLSGICPNSKSINTYSIVLHLFKFHLLDYTGPVYSQYEQATSNYSGIKKNLPKIHYRVNHTIYKAQTPTKSRGTKSGQ